MTQITEHLPEIQRRIDAALKRSSRQGESVMLVAVSKRHSTAAVTAAAAAGLSHFGENYLQEALPKIEATTDLALQWHFVGQLQSNKTRQVAEHFAWADTVDRIRTAERLSAQRPDSLPPLNVLIQLNLDSEPQKAGVGARDILPLAERIQALPGLTLRGVMSMPPADQSHEERRASFLSVAEEARKLTGRGLPTDIISMGMSGDFELAIECGSNCVRIGSALFGARQSGDV